MPLKRATTLLAMRELSNYYAKKEEPRDQDTRQKILETLAVEGFAAWIVHTAIKRNNYRHEREKRATVTSNSNAASTGENDKTGNAIAQEDITGNVKFDSSENI